MSVQFNFFPVSLLFLSWPIPRFSYFLLRIPHDLYVVRQNFTNDLIVVNIAYRLVVPVGRIAVLKLL